MLAVMRVSGSASNWAVGTLMLKLPCASTPPVKVLSLMNSVTVSVGANAPLTLPVMAVLGLVDSAWLMMLSAVTLLSTKDVPVPGVVSTV